METASVCLLWIICAILLLGLVLLPAFIAYKRKHPQVIPIFILDVVIGWTGLGWIFLLAWSLWNFQANKNV